MESAIQTLRNYVPKIFPEKEWMLVDCGAHLGEFTAHAVEALHPSRAIMIEASPELAAGLRSRFSSGNGVTYEVVNAALVEKDEGPISFNVYEDSATSSVLDQKEASGSMKRPLHQIMVDGRSLGSLLGGTSLPCILKTDLQGLDLTILRSAKELLRKQVRVCIVEFIQHDLYAGQGSTLELVRYMGELGYDLFQIVDLHCMASGRLAFGNLVFVQGAIMRSLEEIDRGEPMIPNEHHNPYVLTLKQAAEERLDLIHRLDAEIQRLRPFEEMARKPQLGTLRRWLSKTSLRSFFTKRA